MAQTKKQNQKKAKVTNNIAKQESIVSQPESKYYKIIFYALLGVLLFLIPILSLNSGISGDEVSSYIHSQRVYDYYANGDTACLNTQQDPVTQNLEYYGQTFDNLTTVFVQWFNIDNVFEFRHVCNSLLGWCIILIVGLFLAKTFGYRAAIFGALMLFLSPRFLGHSYNNPKDIPFALGYTMAIYHIMLLMKELPKIKIKRCIYIAIGIAIANSIRIGGLMLVGYLFIFCAAWYFFVNKENKWSDSLFWKKGFILLGKLLLVSLGGYLLSIILWPYMLQSPFAHAKEALELMEHYSVNLRQVFEGVNIWSTNAPWYYLPKYIFMSIPEGVIVGLILFIALIIQIVKRQKGMLVFIVIFSFFFPVFYIIYKASNVYGGWRHVMFIYPFLVIAAAMGWESLYLMLKEKIKPVVFVVFGLLLILPTVHIAKNHPVEYVYYNAISGGVKKNYGQYEMDYYQHSTRPATTWLDNFLQKEGLKNKNKKITIVSNDPRALTYYLRHDTADYYNVEYTRYYERGNHDWDYAIYVNTYINAYQLQQGIWPPKGTFHTIDVDEKPVAAIVKRSDRSDYEGYTIKSQVNAPELDMSQKMTYIQEAISKYTQAINFDPNNEVALTSLMELYSSYGQLDSVIFYTNKLIEVCPSENYLGYAANIYLSAYESTKNQAFLTSAIRCYERMANDNPYSAKNQYDLAFLYARIGNVAKGKSIMEKCFEKNKRTFEANYYTAIYLAQTGNGNQAIELLEKCIDKFPRHAEECQNVINQIRGGR